MKFFKKNGIWISLSLLVVLSLIITCMLVKKGGSPSQGCKLDTDCLAGQMCVNGKCQYPMPSKACPMGINISDQPQSSVQIINNTTENPLTIYIEYANYNPVDTGKPALNPPSKKWEIFQGSRGVTIGDPKNYYPETDPPAGAAAPFYPPNAVGSATWQILEMPKKGDTVILRIPNFSQGQPWSIRPLKKNNNGQPCNGSEGDCGRPILIESGKDMVGDLSAVDGVNFLLCYELTTKEGPTTINVKTNPCVATGQNPKGCQNPSVDGIFKSSLVGTSNCKPPGSKHCWLSDPCPAGTCNLSGMSKKWCDAINDGQCANSSSTWTDKQRGSGGPKTCSDHNLFTAYCYSHNDATSSPYFAAPYQMKLVYSDLA